MADDEVSKELASLARVQTYDVKTIPRRDDLGRDLSFEEAVPHAEKAVALFCMVPLEVLPHLSKSFRNQVRSAADQLFNILEQMQNFSAQHQGATEIRQSLINSLRDSWEPWYNALTPAILYATSTQRDFSQLQRDARAAAQAATDEATSLTEATERGLQCSQRSTGKSIFSETQGGQNLTKRREIITPCVSHRLIVGGVECVMG